MSSTGEGDMETDALGVFPYQSFRPQQADLMKEIQASDELLCCAPTGIGKSISALCGFLADRRKGEKVIVLTRTKTQAGIFLREMSSISRHVGLPLLTIQMRSKKDLCPVFTSDESNYEEFLELCRLNEACEHRRRFQENRGELEALAEEVALAGTDGSGIDFWRTVDMISPYGCPYLVLQGLLKYSDVVIASYLYLLHPFLRKFFLSKLGSRMDQLLVVLDEAHNLQGLDLLGRTLSARTMERASRELNDDLTNIRGLLAGGNAELDALECIDVDNAEDLREAGLEMLRKGLKGGRKTSYTYRLASFLDYALRMGADQNWVFFRQDSRLHMKPLYPSEVIEPVRHARKLLLMSGTLVPMEGYNVLYGMEDAKTITLPDVFPRENKCFYAVKGLNTAMYTRKEKGEALWREYAMVLEEIYLSSPMTTLAFFPSYGIMENVGRHVDAICEPSDSREAESFWRRVRNEESKLALAVSGGKMSEGVEYTIGEGRERRSVVATVAIAGFPFPIPDFEMEMRTRYYEERFGTGTTFFLLSVLPMVNKVLQGIGRAVRSERDRAAIVFLDDRFDYFKHFPEEVRHELQMSKLWSIGKELKGFHQSS
ncbi:MAG: ATP-dependent DNA helicase, partial [Candidatus Hydrothermarchaeaceae archaeon]